MPKASRECCVFFENLSKYMAAHLKFIDAEIEGDEKEFEQASIEIKQWEKYAG